MTPRVRLETSGAELPVHPRKLLPDPPDLGPGLQLTTRDLRAPASPTERLPVGEHELLTSKGGQGHRRDAVPHVEVVRAWSPRGRDGAAVQQVQLLLQILLRVTRGHHSQQACRACRAHLQRAVGGGGVRQQGASQVLLRVEVDPGVTVVGATETVTIAVGKLWAKVMGGTIKKNDALCSTRRLAKLRGTPNHVCVTPTVTCHDDAERTTAQPRYSRETERHARSLPEMHRGNPGRVVTGSCTGSRLLPASGQTGSGEAAGLQLLPRL